MKSRKTESPQLQAIEPAQKTPSLGEKAAALIQRNQKKSANSAQRAANTQKATDEWKAIRNMPKSPNNLMEAEARCNAISAAVNTLKSTNSPKRPFDGLRKNFRMALRNQRQHVSNVTIL